MFVQHVIRYGIRCVHTIFKVFQSKRLPFRYPLVDVLIVVKPFEDEALFVGPDFVLTVEYEVFGPLRLQDERGWHGEFGDFDGLDWKEIK